MIYSNDCPFCNEPANATDEFVDTRNHLAKDGKRTTKRQYFHKSCFLNNTIGVKKK